MKTFVCELCGSNKLVKQDDGMFHCTECGTSYTVEAARKLLVDVEEPSNDFEIVDGVLVRYVGSDVNVVVPEGVKVIGKQAFRGKLIESVVIPEGVTELQDREAMKFGDGAFKDCRKLKSVTLPESLEIIGVSAFEGCSSLKEIALPKNLKRLGNSSFKESGLESIVLPANCNLGFQLFTNCKSLAQATIEDGVDTIPASAFSNCIKLEEVIMPDSVTSIAKFAFSFCAGLKKIHAPQVNSIDAEAFADCDSLTDYTFGEVTYLGEGAFDGTLIRL